VRCGAIPAQFTRSKYGGSNLPSRPQDQFSHDPAREGSNVKDKIPFAASLIFLPRAAPCKAKAARPTINIAQAEGSETAAAESREEATGDPAGIGYFEPNAINASRQSIGFSGGDAVLWSPIGTANQPQPRLGRRIGKPQAKGFVQSLQMNANEFMHLPVGIGAREKGRKAFFVTGNRGKFPGAQLREKFCARNKLSLHNHLAFGQFPVRFLFREFAPVTLFLPARALTIGC
jgi:hypothetical protein